MHAVSSTSRAPGKPWVAASAAMRSPAVRRAEARSDRDGIVPAMLPQSERTLLSREQKPAGSSTGARGSPLSGQEIRWRLCRGCA